MIFSNTSCTTVCKSLEKLSHHKHIVTVFIRWYPHVVGCLSVFDDKIWQTNTICCDNQLITIPQKIWPPNQQGSSGAFLHCIPPALIKPCRFERQLGSTFFFRVASSAWTDETCQQLRFIPLQITNLPKTLEPKPVITLTYKQFNNHGYPQSTSHFQSVRHVQSMYRPFQYSTDHIL